MNRIILALVLVISSFSLNAQTSIGIKGGYTTSSFSYIPALNIRSISVDGLSAPTFAFVFEHFNAKNAGIELNVQYLSTGYNQSITDTEGAILSNETQLDYLKIPMMASFFIGRSGRFQIKFGPHLGYLLSANDIQRDIIDSSPPEIPTYGGADDNPKKLMYGLSAGAGISKLFGKSTIAGEVRFGYDFTNPESQERIFDLNFTTLEFTLAYLFQIKDAKVKVTPK
ncbi:outer membrane beta-barrel protein [Algoriphagus halophilus]|uniref:Outer membrane protein beta-barrel domain-containing protein n=1 Tax=Algoriphagus halophilus TaxID=226505 RepID=A0A1N6FNV5_9BACT|nr:outer membrane beta-barrel protein [Algoriphagus halophilus]SIN96921.1 Outer membrane protein beta-barrel domain-containing protein [Algoriphagus halophilus]